MMTEGHLEILICAEFLENYFNAKEKNLFFISNKLFGVERASLLLLKLFTLKCLIVSKVVNVKRKLILVVIKLIEN